MHGRHPNIPFLWLALLAVVVMSSASVVAQEGVVQCDEALASLGGAGLELSYQITGAEVETARIAPARASGDGAIVQDTVMGSGKEATRVTSQVACIESELSLVSEGTDADATVYSPPLPLLRYPTIEGQSWVWSGDVTITQNDGSESTLSASAYGTLLGQESVETPAGRFECRRLVSEITVDAWGTPTTRREERCVTLEPWPLVIRRESSTLSLTQTEPMRWILSDRVYSR